MRLDPETLSCLDWSGTKQVACPDVYEDAPLHALLALSWSERWTESLLSVPSRFLSVTQYQITKYDESVFS